MIANAALVARLVLVAVFTVAAAAKLADGKGTREAVVQFGAPARFAGVLAVALPAVELATAALLLPASTAAAGSAAALLLLALFTAAVATSLAHGRAPDCHCFGQLHSAPASWKTLVRNAALASAAVFALAASIATGDPSAVAWIGRLAALELLTLVVGLTTIVLVALGAAAFLSLMRSYGNVLVRLEAVETALEHAGLAGGDAEVPPELGLEPGTPAPAFATSDITGTTTALDDLLAPGLPLLLLFTSPSCGPCQAMLPEAARWQRDHADSLTVAFASDGDADAVAAEASEFELARVLHDDERELYRAFEANGTPSAVLIASDGTIASWVAPGREWIEALVDEALAARTSEPALPVGAEPPDVELPLLDGGHLRVADLRGRETLLLFWNPDCGFCRGMHERLRTWERRNGSSPRLVVVSAGDEDEIRAEGFESTVALDPDFSIGDLFGAGGTPMAVLLDAEGRIAAPLAAGEDAIFELTADAENAASAR